jgi:IS30 family transposase
MTTKLSGRLTEEAVREVRARRARGETYVQIATALNISPSTVYNIVKRKTWGSLK